MTRAIRAFWLWLWTRKASPPAPPVADDPGIIRLNREWSDARKCRNTQAQHRAEVQMRAIRHDRMRAAR